MPTAFCFPILQSMGYSLVKMSSAGNRFLVAGFQDLKTASSRLVKTRRDYGDFLNLPRLSLKDRGRFLKSLGDKRAEGLAVLKPSRSLAFECDFYNRDGSSAEMCGNLSCCLILYAQTFKLAGGRAFYFKVGKEKVKAFERDGKYWVGVKKPAPLKSGFSLPFQGAAVPYSFISIGVPHAVVEWKKPLNRSVLRPLARRLRRVNPVNKTGGMNVSFFFAQKDRSLKAVTFERGVEDWTRACGTGALAVAWVFSRKFPFQERDVVPVKMPGGVLEVLTRPSPALFSKAKWGY